MNSELSQRIKPHVQRLEQYLSPRSGEDQVWFSPADPVIVNQISQKYVLPEVYLEYLTQYGANRIDLDMFILFSAEQLLQNQLKWTPDGMPSLFAIGENALDDPIMLQLSKSNGNDAPFVSVMSDGFDFEDAEEEDFDEESASFVDYLELLAVLCEASS